MAALLGHPLVPSRSPGRGRGHLRLIQGGRAAGPPIDPGCRPSDHGSPLEGPLDAPVSSPVEPPDRWLGEPRHPAADSPFDQPVGLALVVASVALVVFGFIGVIRLVQGSPSNTGGEVRSAGSGVAGSVGSTAPVVDEARGDRLVVVEPGDSLWSIAVEMAPDRDPRPLVTALAEANGGVSLQIGQQIVIPGQLLD